MALVDADDRTLAGRASDGDVRAFEVLIRRYGPYMRAYSTRVLGSTDEVDDVVQESFITAWQQLPQLADLTAVKSWLMRIVSHKCIDRIRARRPHADIDDHEPHADDGESPPRRAEAMDRERALEAALAALPEQQRQSWLLREMSGLSYDEIAEELGVPASTVRGFLVRARKSLIRDMEGWR
ncbi:RNA polymerase sigma factor [Naasia lichenicola]|uniref:RNA polymerase sigma factor n=1 Tax=Naasia lichenicola TaxID=2565933 RepID=UPI001E3D1FD4|nr:RNA polymerase sigma factor [Naasia lichenicola]